MAPDIDLPKIESDGLTLKWSRGLSLTGRILAVNLFVIALIVGGLFFLDSYRERLILERETNAVHQVQIIGNSLPFIQGTKRDAFLLNFARQDKIRIRIYDKSGRKIVDSFELGKPTYDISDPAHEPWEKIAARQLDKIFDFVVLAQKLPVFAEPKQDVAPYWDEIEALQPGKAQTMTRLAPDYTHVVSAAWRARDDDHSILLTTNARDIRIFVRSERFNISIFFLLVIGIAVLLSLFLARTIVQPLRHLARAAVKVRLGRAQEVTVPRLPSRRDEIGMLARALSDMSTALRHRIDATEAFAADVAHEIKNPLASLRSALDGMDHVKDHALRDQLMSVAKADVHRMDRLISDISEASRVDSHLAKSKFERIDLGDMIEQLLIAREGQNSDGTVKIAFARPRRGTACIMGEDIRLERVLTNLLDNAVSFSPSDGLVEISATCANDQVIIRITDEGPGIPKSEREEVFRRFHTERPKDEGFGKHSGLGLAIARTIIEGHQGHVWIDDREDNKSGACFKIVLPFSGRKLA